MPTHDITQLIEALPQPTVLVGADGLLRAMNRSADALLGHDLVGRHYVTALRQPALLDRVEAILGGEPAGQSRFLATEGRRDTFWQVDIAPMADTAGRGAVLVFTDTTEAADALQMRRDFIANVSHELRSPITAILGFIETLQGPASQDAAARARFLTVMQSEAERMNRLVDDLLQLNRVEQSERRRPMTPVDLNGLVTATSGALAPLAEIRGTKVLLQLSDPPIHVPGDLDQLRQALGNLVENAIKYGGDGSTVTLSLSTPAFEPQLQGQGVRLTVADQGAGIAPQHIPRLTERFYRVDDHRGRNAGGTGLGLAIVKHIMNRHRGRLLIESQQGAGSEFTLLLPLS